MKTPTNETPIDLERLARACPRDVIKKLSCHDLKRIVDNYNTPPTSLSYQPCGTCDGETVVDSGGVTPWGAAIDLPCPECVSQDPLLDQASVSNHGDHTDTGGRHSEPQTAPVLDAEGFRRLDKLIDDLKQRIAEYPSNRAEWGMNEWSTLVSLTRAEQLRSKGIPLGPINPSGFSQPDQLK